MSTWDDEQYLRFADERTRAARELLARVPLDDSRVARVVDLGCGPGNSTALLTARWPQADVLGIDNAPAMLARAQRDCPGARFLAADIATWQPDAPVDVVFTNAALQWLPDHAALFPRLLAALRPGGVLAVQMPRNFDEPSHRLMREVATAGPAWRDATASARARSNVAAPAGYYDLLAPHSKHVDIWQTIYEQVMPDVGAIVEWVQGTGLRPYLDALPTDEERMRFTHAYTTALRRAYPLRVDGRVLFTFPRLFVVATRA